MRSVLPMNAIVGFSSLLATASSEEEKNMYTDIINQNSDRLLQLISDILDLSQIEAGSFDFHYSKFNANDLLRELYALFNIRLVEKPEVTLVCEADLTELTIYSERRSIMQVFMNLLTKHEVYPEWRDLFWLSGEGWKRTVLLRTGFRNWNIF